MPKLLRSRRFLTPGNPEEIAIVTRHIPRHDGFLRLRYLPKTTVSEQSAVIGPVVILLFFSVALQPLTDLVL